MARAAKKTSKASSGKSTARKSASKASAKGRGSPKAAPRSPAKKGSAKGAGTKSAGTRAAAKRGAARGASKGGRRQSSQGSAQSWFGALNTLMASGPGRDIIADVLEAAAGALRRHRANVSEAMEAGAERMSDATGAAANVATEMAMGTVELAQTAATVLADVVTDAARSVLPGGIDEDDERSERSGSRRSGGSE